MDHKRDRKGVLPPTLPLSLYLPSTMRVYLFVSFGPPKYVHVPAQGTGNNFALTGREGGGGTRLRDVLQAFYLLEFTLECTIL